MFFALGRTQKEVDGLLDSIRGALYGVAIGDALGATTEFLSKEEIERQGR